MTTQASSEDDDESVPSNTPLPGRPVRGSAGGRPIMAALNLLSRRWTLRILWELRTGEAVGFRDLQRRCDDMSPNTLSTRLSELQEAGLLEQTNAKAWKVTALGRSLEPALTALNEWADEWVEAIGERPDAE